jgi:hypothetical protein
VSSFLSCWRVSTRRWGQSCAAGYIVAEGADKYRAVYSLAEVDPAFHAGTVIVADREDGQPMAKDGPFKLVNTEDKRPARWVRNLVSIQMRSIP